MSLSAAAATEMFRREPDRFLDVGVGEVAHRRVGSGPDVLFVHGWPVSGATFRTLLPHLADHVTCHVIDLPGAGSSRFAPDAPLTIETHIRSVRRVLDLLELNDVAVVGHDSGGMIAAEDQLAEHGNRHGHEQPPCDSQVLVPVETEDPERERAERGDALDA